MSKIKINKIVNLPKLTHRVFILLWIILGFALILKFCFNWLFPIAVESEAFIKLCDFIEKHIYIDYAMMYVFYMLNCNVVFLINSVKKKYKNILELILMNLLFTLGYLVKLLVGNAIGTIFELIYILLIPMIHNIRCRRFKKPIFNILFVLAMYVIINLWQLNIFIIRDVKEYINNGNVIIKLALQIDYYIFLFILFMEVNYMGLMGIGWLWQKTESELLAIKEAELLKDNPDKKLLEQIEKRLEELKDE